jgi:hypothetical protein
MAFQVLVLVIFEAQLHLDFGLHVPSPFLYNPFSIVWPNWLPFLQLKNFNESVSRRPLVPSCYCLHWVRTSFLPTRQMFLGPETCPDLTFHLNKQELVYIL